MSDLLVIYDPAYELARSQRDALRGDWGVASVRTRLALRRAAPGADAVVLSAGSSASWRPAFHDLVECAPSVPRLIIASLAFRPRRALLEAARQGALLFFAPSPAALRRGARDALRRDPWRASAAALLDRELRRLPNRELGALLALAASHGRTAMRVPQLAALLDHSPRTLARWCAAMGGPSPHAVIAWGRVLHAAAMREVASAGELPAAGPRAARGIVPPTERHPLRLAATEPASLSAAVDALMAECGDRRPPLRPGAAPTLRLIQGGRR